MRRIRGATRDVEIVVIEFGGLKRPPGCSTDTAVEQRIALGDTNLFIWGDVVGAEDLVAGAVTQAQHHKRVF